MVGVVERLTELLEIPDRDPVGCKLELDGILEEDPELYQIVRDAPDIWMIIIYCLGI